MHHSQVTQSEFSRVYMAASLGYGNKEQALPLFVLAQVLGGGKTSRLYRSLVTQQKLAVHSGHWPLYRYRPSEEESAKPFQLDSAAPSVPYTEFAGSEARFAMLQRSNPERAGDLSSYRCRGFRWRGLRSV